MDIYILYICFPKSCNLQLMDSLSLFLLNFAPFQEEHWSWLNCNYFCLSMDTSVFLKHIVWRILTIRHILKHPFFKVSYFWIIQYVQ